MELFTYTVFMFMLGWMAGQWPLWNDGYKEGFETGRKRFSKMMKSKIQELDLMAGDKK